MDYEAPVVEAIESSASTLVQAYIGPAYDGGFHALSYFAGLAIEED